MVVSPKDRTTSSSVGAKSSRVVDWMRSTVGQSMTNVDSSPTAVLMSTDVVWPSVWMRTAGAGRSSDAQLTTEVGLWSSQGGWGLWTSHSSGLWNVADWPMLSVGVPLASAVPLMIS